MSIIETMIDIPMEHERNVCGQFDAYLKKIERTLHVTMITRDGALKIIGPEQTIRQAKSVFNNLLELSKRGNTITEQNVDYALSLSSVPFRCVIMVSPSLNASISAAVYRS